MSYRVIDVVSRPSSFRGGPVLAAVALICAAGSIASPAEATVLTHEGLGTNVSLQDPTKGAAVANYGSRVAGAGTGVQQGNGYTPNVAVLFTPDGGNTGG